MNPNPITPDDVGVYLSNPPPVKLLAYWLRRFLAGNPFYPVSAALLLFGINRLSVDPAFLPVEGAKLAFNFGALQVYEMLLVITAVVLARRGIWYDCTLLVFLENLLVLVPFMLVAQAILLSQAAAWAVCLAGTVLVCARFWTLKHFLPELNLSPRLLGCGAFVVVINLALPLGFRSVIEHGFDDWEALTPYLWFGLLPLLAMLAQVLPAPARSGSRPTQRGWLPMSLLALWIAGTGVHLWILGYLSLQVHSPHLLAPLVWAVAWTLYRRGPDFFPLAARRWREGFIGVPALTTLLGIRQADSHVFFTLTALNVLVYAGLGVSRRTRSPALPWLLVSCLAMIAGIPEAWGQWLLPHFSRRQWIAIGMSAYVLWCASRSTKPRIGLCGAIVAAMVPSFVLQGHGASLMLGVQMGLAYFLTHSLCWCDAEHEGADIVRVSVAIGWIAQAALWGPGGASATILIASAVLAVCWMRRLLCRNWGSWIVPAAALVSSWTGPLNQLCSKLVNSPVGLLAVIGSFLLFAAGTFVALTKHRWVHK